MDVIHQKDNKKSNDDLGGKAEGLLHLTSLGANVPPFFVIHPDVFFRHLPKDSWQTFVSEPTERTTKELCTALERVSFDDSFQKQLTTALQNFEDGTLFAIRSSMLGEDGAEYSFAGQLESFLFQEGIQSVSQSIRNCWCSCI